MLPTVAGLGSSFSLTHPSVVSAGDEHNSSDAYQLKYGAEKQTILQNLIENISFCKRRIYRHLARSMAVNDTTTKKTNLQLFSQITHKPEVGITMSQN